MAAGARPAYVKVIAVGYCGTLMVVFTMVTDALRDMALPFNTVCTALPAVEKVTPADERILPVITPPPAPLMVAALPTYQ